jgi:hypothetical protein
MIGEGTEKGKEAEVEEGIQMELREGLSRESHNSWCIWHGQFFLSSSFSWLPRFEYTWKLIMNIIRSVDIQLNLKKLHCRISSYRGWVNINTIMYSAKSHFIKAFKLTFFLKCVYWLVS